jgi:hypothetical protein
VTLCTKEWAYVATTTIRPEVRGAGEAGGAKGERNGAPGGSRRVPRDLA